MLKAPPANPRDYISRTKKKNLADFQDIAAFMLTQLWLDATWDFDISVYLDTLRIQRSFGALVDLISAVDAMAISQ